MLMRRAVKGDIGLIAPPKRLADEVIGPLARDAGATPCWPRPKRGDRLEEAALLVLGTTMQRFGDQPADEQEALMATADLPIEAFGAESALLRAEQAQPDGVSPRRLARRSRRGDRGCRAARRDAAREALAALADGDMLRIGLSALRRLLKSAPIDTVALRRAIAADVRGRPAAPGSTCGVIRLCDSLTGCAADRSDALRAMVTLLAGGVRVRRAGALRHQIAAHRDGKGRGVRLCL